MFVVPSREKGKEGKRLNPCIVTEYVFFILALEEYLLLKDMTVETVSWSIPLVNISKTSQTGIQKGELLIHKDGWLYLKGNDDARFQFEADKVAPLDRELCSLLEANPSPKARMAVFMTAGWLDWGVAVKKGDKVYIRVPMKDNAEGCCSTAIVHCVGRLSEDQPGTMFGVEITVSKYW